MGMRIGAGGCLGMLIGCALFLSSALPAFAADYSMMPTDELARLRGTMQNAPIEERQAFQNEWQRRVRAMTPGEQQRYLGRPEWAEGKEQQDQQKREGFQEGRIKRDIEGGPAGGGSKGR